MWDLGCLREGGGIGGVLNASGACWMARCLFLILRITRIAAVSQANATRRLCQAHNTCHHSPGSVSGLRKDASWPFLTSLFLFNLEKESSILLKGSVKWIGLGRFQ